MEGKFGSDQLQSSPNDQQPNHEFYIKDLEAKLDSYRMREFGLTEELDRMLILVHGLQKENAEIMEREREFICIQVN